jgi:hypothetical protein
MCVLLLLLFGVCLRRRVHRVGSTVREVSFLFRTISHKQSINQPIQLCWRLDSEQLTVTKIPVTRPGLSLTLAS